MQPPQRRCTFGGMALICITVMLGGCGQTADPGVPAAPAVTIAQPLAIEVTDWDEFTGRFAAVESVEVQARVSGYLESIDFRDGAMVRANDPLFVIDPRPYAALLNEAKAELTREQVQLELANSDLLRAQRLIKTHAIPEEELDARTQEQRQAIAALEAATASVDSAQLNVDFTHVKAPISGRIGRARVTKGNLVSGGSEGGTIVTTIVSLDPIHFYFTGNEQMYLQYLRLDRAGGRPSSHNFPNPVHLRISDEDGYDHVGTMDFVDNRIDESTGTMQGRAIFPNPEFVLVPGMFGEIRLVGEGPYKAVLIPDAAIGTDQSQQFVFVLDERNVAQRRQIETGRLEQGLRIVRAGLSSSDRVVVNGIQRVRAGEPVTPEPSKLELGSLDSEKSKPL